MDAISILFIVTSIVIIMTPGQDFILVMSRSLVQGKKAGVITALGVSIGLMGHTILATLGLGALLMTSEWLFDVIKLIGAAYLIYIGYQLLRTSNASLNMKQLDTVSYKKMFVQGAISNIMNPKIAIFYFAYLPQFVVADSSSETWQLFVLGTLFALLTFVIKGPLGYVSGMLSFWIQTREFILKYVYKTSGLILVVLGFKLALSQRN